MLTLSSNADNTHILSMKPDKGKGETKVYWHPTLQPELRNSVESLDYFFKNDRFRDRYELSGPEADEIQEALNGGSVCCKYQKKFFQCKRHITDSLFSEMDISDDQQSFVLDFPEGGNTYGWCCFVCGGSGSGKSHWVINDRILRNLKGPKKNRRKFIYCSAELSLDKTLAPVRDDEKYSEWFCGIDISEEAIKESSLTPEAYYDQKIAMRVDTAVPGTILVCDDYRDSVPEVAERMRRLIDRIQRVGRHRKLGLIFILHKLKSGMWSTTAYSSCKFICCFPRSQKNKIRDLLEHEFGFTKKEARRTVADFAQTGRACWIHCHAPNYIANDKLLRLI
jgi:hypothetical protein